MKKRYLIGLRQTAIRNVNGTRKGYSEFLLIDRENSHWDMTMVDIALDKAFKSKNSALKVMNSLKEKVYDGWNDDYNIYEFKVMEGK